MPQADTPLPMAQRRTAMANSASPLAGSIFFRAHGALVCAVFIGNGAVQGRGVLLRGSDEPLAVGKSHGRKVCPHVLHGVGVVHPFQHERGVLRL